MRGQILSSSDAHAGPRSAERQASTRGKLIEIAEILAAGLMRALARKSSQISPRIGESPLDFSAPESGHPTPEKVSNG